MHSDSLPPKKVKSIFSAGKCMASVFWDAKRILLIDYLEKGLTINGKHCAKLLEQLNEKFVRRTGFSKEMIIFCQINTWPDRKF